MSGVPTRVAVGMIQQGGKVLLAQRPEGKPYAGWWEFPGGKLEDGETPAAALARELHEELALQQVASWPWVVREHVYPHATVQLFFRRVHAWQGQAQPCEGQVLSWQPADAVALEPLLPACRQPLAWLQLPALYLISCAAEMGAVAFEQALMARLGALPAGQVLWLLWREPVLAPEAYAALWRRVCALRAQAPLRVLVSSRHPRADWHAADGVHLTARDVYDQRERPAVPWVAASCHTPADLARAAALGCDCAVLGPVHATASHPGQPGVGWPVLTQWLAQAPLPVYALGGLTAADVSLAQQAGAQGVAMMRAAWR